MKEVFYDQSVVTILEQVKRNVFPYPVADPFEEEERQSFPHCFDEIAPVYPIEAETVELIDLGKEKTDNCILFEAFLDGVQRTVILPYRVNLPNGASVPLHVAQIAAGVILRDKNTKKLFVDPDLVASRLLLLGPFKGIGETGGPEIHLPEGTVEDHDDRTFTVPKGRIDWIVCDTTFRGTERDSKRVGSEALMGDALFNEHLVRERAQGRVTILRQRLELAVLLEFKAKYGDKWVLVDGSLFLIDKWRSRMSRIFGTRLGTDSEAQFEENLLKKVVGVIRTHRLRFEKIQKVLHLKYHQRSTVFRLFEEVDIKGRKWMLEEKGMYSEPHFTWYTRFRTTCPISQGMAGLVRIDVHRATLGFSRDEEINPHTFEKSRNTVDEITRSVLAEQFPAQHRRIGYDNTPQVYPVRELEKMLRATILPVRTMRNLFNTVLG